MSAEIASVTAHGVPDRSGAHRVLHVIGSSGRYGAEAVIATLAAGQSSAGTVVHVLILMLVYSVRDGFVVYWFKGIADGVKGVRSAIVQRESPRRETMVLLREIDRNRPTLRKMLARRLRQRTVRI